MRERLQGNRADGQFAIDYEDMLDAAARDEESNGKGRGERSYDVTDKKI
jgi:hypothetical protein